MGVASVSTFAMLPNWVLFGIRGMNNRTLKSGRTQTNIIGTRKREHSRKPDEMWGLIERCSPGPRLEMFARHYRHGWHQWGDQSNPRRCNFLGDESLFGCGIRRDDQEEGYEPFIQRLVEGAR